MQTTQLTSTITLIILIGLWSWPAWADNDTTNSNNSTVQSNEIKHHDTYDSHDQVVDSSVSTDSSVDNSIDNSAYGHNVDGSYNQANVSTITNTNTEGDLDRSKNTNSFNTNTGNSNGSNVNQSATGGVSSSQSDSSSGSSSRSSAYGGSAGSSSVTFNQVKQHRVVPFAFAPGLALSFSQDNCANSASMGASTGIMGMSMGMPINNDACNRRKDVQMWLAVQQPRIACERMVQDNENMQAMRKAGLTCEQLSIPVAVNSQPIASSLDVPPGAYWDKLGKIADAQISGLHKKLMGK